MPGALHLFDIVLQGGKVNHILTSPPPQGASSAITAAVSAVYLSLHDTGLAHTSATQAIGATRARATVEPVLQHLVAHAMPQL